MRLDRSSYYVRTRTRLVVTSVWNIPQHKHVKLGGMLSAHAQKTVRTYRNYTILTLPVVELINSVLHRLARKAI